MPVSAIIGRPGSGKSFVMASIARRHLDRGRDVFANYQIDGVQSFVLDEMADLPPGLVLVDEAQNWFHSRKWKGMPDSMLERWSQTRHAGWDVYFGSQHESNVDSVLRRVCQWGWLLEARWSTLTVFDRRVRQAARDSRERRLAQFHDQIAVHEALDIWTYPGGPHEHVADLARIRRRAASFLRSEGAMQHTHPLYIYGRRWDFDHFRNTTQKGRKPLQRKRWWWNWDIAASYDTFQDVRLRNDDDRETTHA